MLRNYLKIAVRSIRKYKGYTLINVTGLAISLACCMLIGLWILNEMSFDKHYVDQDQVQVILTDGQRASANTLAPYLEENVPEIQHAARISYGNEMIVHSEGYDSFENLLAADPQILQIMSFPFVSGDPETALDEPNSVIITQRLADKFFPDELAVGRSLSIDDGSEYVVKGVIEDIPANSTFQFDLLTSIDYTRQQFNAMGFEFESWKSKCTRTLVKTQPGITVSALSEKISGLIQQFYEDREVTLSAINVGDLYLRFSGTTKGIKIFSAIALAILLMALVNYVNLSTARFRLRARETGIRKIVGASRGALMAQYLGESVFLVAVGSVLALCLVDILLPFFNSMFQMQLTLGLMSEPSILIGAVATLLVIALAAGIYPAVVLSRFHPVQTVKRGLDASNKRVTLRRILVVSQFSLTAVLMIGTAVIYTQLKHMKSWDVGYDKEHVVNINLRGKSQDHFATLKNELLQNPEIVAVTGGMEALPYWYMETSVTWDGLNPDEERDVSFNLVKHDFARTFGIELVEGRDFDPAIPTDESSALVINETLAKALNRSPVLGTYINFWEREYKIIGIAKDFNFLPLDTDIGPMLLAMLSEELPALGGISLMSIRISSDDIGSSIAYIEETWNRIVPNHPFEYTFLDQEFDANYRSLDQVNGLAVCFGLLAVCIAGLGLFGLASFTAEQRTKEIGIRKVLGASVTNIIRMISKEYVVLVAISNLVAWPLAWYIMRDWLSEFAYHIDIGASTFIVVGCFTLVVALLSVGYQAIRAANTNPVDAIEYE